MSIFQCVYPKRAIDVTKNFSSIESQGFYLIVSLPSGLPPHQSEPMPTAKDNISNFGESVKVFLTHKLLSRLHPLPKGRGLTGSANSNIEIIKHLNSPSGEYDYYIENPKFQFLDSEGNVKVMEILGFYVNIGSPVEITCKVESIDELFNSD